MKITRMNGMPFRYFVYCDFGEDDRRTCIGRHTTERAWRHAWKKSYVPIYLKNSNGRHDHVWVEDLSGNLVHHSDQRVDWILRTESMLRDATDSNGLPAFAALAAFKCMKSSWMCAVYEDRHGKALSSRQESFIADLAVLRQLVNNVLCEAGSQ